jgi:glutamine phosphoribosylpyrophosphate amidotransferase
MGNNMAELICSKAFKLNTADRGLVQYVVGQKVEGKDAENWYAKAHCKGSKAEVNAAQDRDPVKDSFETRKLLAELSADGNTPNMKDVQKALREAGLPALENADARDKILNAIAEDKAKADLVAGVSNGTIPAPAPAEGGNTDGNADNKEGNAE